MAEAVLNIVVGKLADVIAKEAQLLGGVGIQVERVERDLIRIKCRLEGEYSKRKGDASVQNWLNELRTVAYRIEDTIDTFFLEVKDHRQNYPRLLQKLKKLFNKPLEVQILHRLGIELNSILNVLEEILLSSDRRYGFRDQLVEDRSKGEAVRMPLRRAAYSEVDENQVEGMQADKNNIMELLRDKKTFRRAVISIVGTGGLGKTTLACMVYRSVKAYFDYHIMLSISQQFSLTDLLRKMINKYNKNFALENQDVEDLAHELKSYLSSKIYLIILDDVWNTDLWNELKDILPDVMNGSRVLMTSRFIEVARSADFEMTPYKLNFLDDRESLNLLLNKSLPSQELDRNCHIDLHGLAEKLSKKCKGLPLALIVLSGILSTKEPSYPAWERVLQTLNWYSDRKEFKECMDILAMSYEDMPYYLKACFQYLAFFPEDHVISAKCLIRMWVAEGFIPLDAGSTIEIMAENCLEELAKRSMIQVLSRHTNGLIKHFQVHDILRGLAIKEAEHENFVTVFSQTSNERESNRIIRRASLQAQQKYLRFMAYAGPKSRSFLFGTRCFGIDLNCSNFRLLKVLVIMGTKEYRYELKSLDELIHLKYLRLSCYKIDLSSHRFRRMKSLETLDVRGSLCSNCGDFWTVGTLLHVRVDENTAFSYAPKSKATLSNLRTLKWVTFQGECDAKLPNLRKLYIKNESDQWLSITNLLQTLPFLISLGIEGPQVLDLPKEIIYPIALPDYQNLQSLLLYGKWPKEVNIEASSLPSHLVKLSLRYTYLNYNPMPELGKLNSLKKLSLGSRVFPLSWEAPIICRKGFPVLQHLIVTRSNIKDLTVEKGVMPKLTFLQKTYKMNVNLPHELQQQVTVERLIW